MTRSHRLLGAAVCVVSAAAVLSGCAASHPQQSFAMSFLPAPLAAPVAFDEPPRVNPHLSREVPKFLSETPTPKTSDADGRIRRADARFENGKKLYSQGDTEGARREFNAAVDVLLSASENIPDRQKIERRLEQLIDTIYRFDLEGLGSGAGQSDVVYDKSPLDGMLDMTFPTDPNLKPKVKEELMATVSQLPLDANDAVLGYIHYFSTERGRKTLMNGLKHAGRYKPLIQRILDEEGVPQELIFLAQAESGFLPRAVSNKNATGMWQFVQWRGREYGLQQSRVSDDRLDPEKATRAAARHLRDLYKQLGDWYLAMAAYNCGPGCVDRAVQRTGFADFWELRRRSALPRETCNYVPLILAMTIMAKNPKDYGLENIETENPIEYDTIELPSATNVALVADAAERPISEIRDLNPSLLSRVAPAGYQLRVPKGTLGNITSALESIPHDHRASWRMHRVSHGETLAEIARQFRTPASSIAEINRVSAEAPEAGDMLIIPAYYQPESAPARHTSRHGRHATVQSRRGERMSHHAAHGRAAGHHLAASHRVPARVLHHRAGARAVRTASR